MSCLYSLPPFPELYDNEYIRIPYSTSHIILSWLSRHLNDHENDNEIILRIRHESSDDEKYSERWGAGVETQKNVRGEIGGWGQVPFNEPYAPLLSTIYDGA